MFKLLSMPSFCRSETKATSGQNFDAALAGALPSQPEITQFPRHHRPETGAPSLLNPLQETETKYALKKQEADKLETVADTLYFGIHGSRSNISPAEVKKASLDAVKIHQEALALAKVLRSSPRYNTPDVEQYHLNLIQDYREKAIEMNNLMK